MFLIKVLERSEQDTSGLSCSIFLVSDEGTHTSTVLVVLLNCSEHDTLTFPPFLASGKGEAHLALAWSFGLLG